MNFWLVKTTLTHALKWFWIQVKEPGGPITGNLDAGGSGGFDAGFKDKVGGN